MRSIIGRRDRQNGCEGSFNSRPSHGSSVDKPQAFCEDKDGSLQCLRYQHIAVWRRDMNYVCLAGEKAKKKILLLRRLRWLGHVRRMEDGCIPKDILYGELALGRRTTDRPHLRYKDVCIRDTKAVDIDTMSWEGLAADRTKWRSALKQHLETGEEKLMAAAADKRACRKEGSSSIRPETTRRCDVCNKDCHSRIGLFIHKRRCNNPARN